MDGREKKTVSGAYSQDNDRPLIFIWQFLLILFVPHLAVPVRGENIFGKKVKCCVVQLSLIRRKFRENL